MLIETHAHLDDKQFDADCEEVISRAFANGVGKIINIGAGLGSSQRSVALAEKYANIFCAVGLHPHYFNEYGERSMDKISEFEELATHKKVVAIGEIGLDYFSHSGSATSEEEKERQKAGFIFQLELAKKLNLPVIIHCRDAYADAREIIQKYPKLNFVYHCYGGDADYTKKLLAKDNIYFSFTGNITYPKKEAAEIFAVVKMIPIEKIMLETDCPYLAPMPLRGKRNEPGYVKYVAQKIAELKNLSEEEVAKITTETAENFFGI